MGQVVYADLLFLIDFSMDFLCFYITARLLHRKFSLLRSILGAALGGVYSVAVIFFSMNVWLGLLSDLGICSLMCLIAFGCADKSLYEFCLCASSYFGVSACLGGFMTAIYSLLNRLNIPFDQIDAEDGISVWLFGILALLSGFAAMMSGRFFRGPMSAETAEVEITYGGKSITVRALVDTGNMISDPISGRSVIVLDKSAARGIMPEECVDMAVAGRVGMIPREKIEGIRLIPIETAAGGSMICAFKPERVKVRVTDKRGRVRSVDASALFAPAELSFSCGRGAVECRALISPELLL